MVKGIHGNRPVHQPTVTKNTLPKNSKSQELKEIRPEAHSEATVPIADHEMKKVASSPSQYPARKAIEDQVNAFKVHQGNKTENAEFDDLLPYAKLKSNIEGYEKNLSLKDWISHMFHKILLRNGLTYQATQYYDSYIGKLDETQKKNLKAIEESLLDPQKNCFVKELISSDDKGNISKFTGELKNGQYYFGQLMKKEDGKLEEYKGYFKDNKYEGEGILEKINEDEDIIYKGNFEEGKITKGDYEDILGEGIKYLGTFVEKNEKMIFSPKKIISPQGEYEGQIKDDKPHGKGKIVYVNETSYEGDFVNGKRHGKGVEVKPNGDTYEGAFVNGKRHGEGVEIKSNGDIFDGKFENGEFLSGRHTIKETGAVERVY
jgi:hypothetical protein